MGNICFLLPAHATFPGQRFPLCYTRLSLFQLPLQEHLPAATGSSPGPAFWADLRWPHSRVSLMQPLSQEGSPCLHSLQTPAVGPSLDGVCCLTNRDENKQRYLIPSSPLSLIPMVHPGVPGAPCWRVMTGGAIRSQLTLNLYRISYCN